MKELLVLVVGALSVLPVGVNSAMVVSSATYGPDSLNFSGSVNLDRFNVPLATLTMVTLEITAEFGATVAVENNTGAPATATVALFGQVQTSGAPAGLAPVAFFTDPVADWDLAASDGSFGSGPDFHNFGPLTSDAIGSVSTMNPVDLAQYVGALPFVVYFDANAGWSVSGLTASLISIATSPGGGTVKVTYEYFSVPEPHNYALLAGLGLIGLAAVRRIRS